MQEDRPMAQQTSRDSNGRSRSAVRRLVGAAAALVAGIVAADTGAQAKAFRFDQDTAGWSVFNIHYLGQPLADPAPVGGVPFDAGNGLPPGSARVSDLTAETWIGAKAAVEGDRSALYGESVSYDILFREADSLSYAAVALYGGSLTLYQAMPAPPLDAWLHWEFPLVPGDWRIGSVSGAAATEEDLLLVLADFKGLFIHTEWKTGSDDTNVDNVRLGTCGAAECCPADLDDDGSVGPMDLAILLGAWGVAGAPDLDESGTVGAEDLAILLGEWGTC
jgi:hypothetical protein